MNITIDRIRALFTQYKRTVIPVTKYPDVRQASVLFLLVQVDGELHVLLTERTNDVETHKGQISFPGGMRDESDSDVIATALREAEEEIGLPGTSVELLGILDDFITPTHFLITPVVGYIPNLPDLTPNRAEVAEIFLVPLSFFADERNGKQEQRTYQGKEYTIWFFQYGKHLIWGATAGMIKRLLDVLITHKEIR